VYMCACVCLLYMSAAMISVSCGAI
jgi:hypothetical protein